MTDGIKAIIPRHVANRTVLAAYRILRRYTNKIPENKILQNAAANSIELHNHARHYFPGESKYIENQADWGKIRFGSGRKSNMSYSGCGIIAAYNALASLGESTSPDIMVDLIGHFERDGAALNGNFGIAPHAVRDYFTGKGFEAVFTGDNKRDVINKIGETCDAVIVTAYNDKTDITAMVHTVCMHTLCMAEKDGYVIHNGYHRDAGGIWNEHRTGIHALADAITHIGTNSAAISVIGIRKRLKSL